MKPLHIHHHRFMRIGKAIHADILVDDFSLCKSLESSDFVFPCGEYSVVLEYSPAFKRDLPEFYGIEGRSEIKYHAGNTLKHTRGCPLVGMKMGRDHISIRDSRIAENELVALIRKAGGRCVVTVTED